MMGLRRWFPKEIYLTTFVSGYRPNAKALGMSVTPYAWTHETMEPVGAC